MVVKHCYQNTSLSLNNSIMKTIFLYLIPLLMFPGKRSVYIFYNEVGAAQKNEQLNELHNDDQALKERDIIIESIDVNSNNNAIKKWNINTAKPFTFILVGKDGTEKLRSDTLITTAKLFSIIDAMPMRKTEMKNNDNK